MDHIKPFRVHLGGRRFRRFRTMAEASKYCNRHFEGTGVVLSIVEAKTASVMRARRGSASAHTSAHTSHASRPR